MYNYQYKNCHMAIKQNNTKWQMLKYQCFVIAKLPYGDKIEISMQKMHNKLHLCSSNHHHILIIQYLCIMIFYTHQKSIKTLLYTCKCATMTHKSSSKQLLPYGDNSTKNMKMSENKPYVYIFKLNTNIKNEHKVRFKMLKFANLHTKKMSQKYYIKSACTLCKDKKKQ